MIFQEERIELWIFYCRFKSITFFSFVSCVLAICSNDVIFGKLFISVSEIICNFSKKSSLESLEFPCIFFVMTPNILHRRVEVERDFWLYASNFMLNGVFTLIDIFGNCKRRNQNIVWLFFLYFARKYFHQ